MDRKRKLTDVSDPELDDIVSEDGNDSSDYVPSENSNEESDDEVVSEPEDEMILEPEDNQDASQETTSNTSDNLWTENRQIPEIFIFQENIGLKLNNKSYSPNAGRLIFFSRISCITGRTNEFICCTRNCIIK